jgi:TolB-like protein/class 3 adenylate cyclase/Flp pilus assembly protein TadD
MVNLSAADKMSAEIKKEIQLEIAHVLFIDIVGYSKLSISDQHAAVEELNQLVRASEQFQRAEAASRLLKIPTGDGIALVFYTTPEAPAQSAVEISRALNEHPRLQLRMGIHSGPVSGVVDVNERSNLAGAGINIAQRVMDCGDAGHILLSKHVAEDLEEYERWRALLHDLGSCEVKHGVRVSVVNLYDDQFGNAKLPRIFETVQKRRTRLRWAAMTVALLTLAAIVGGIAMFSRYRGQSTLAAPEKSIAVLPFENLSDDKANAYFVAGMQDEILTALAKVRDLKVISKTSTAKYQSRPANLKTIAKELGVAAILEGSVQRLGDAVHINVQLLNARDDAHLWAESYDRELKKVFEVEREVAEAVAGKLKAQLSPQDTKELARVPTSNPQAYDRYLKGEFARNEFKAARANSLKPAINLFKEAIALDPRFALAYAHLADAEMRSYFMVERSPQLITDGQAHLAKALELDPDLIDAHLLQAKFYQILNHDAARALAEVEPLLSRAPNDPRILEVTSSAKGAMGDSQGQLAAIQRAIELDPRNTEYLQSLGDFYVDYRRYAEGIETFSRVRALEPEDWVTRIRIALSLINIDRLAEAQAELEQWPDAKLHSLIVAAKYGFLQQIAVLNGKYDAALALGAKIPDIPNRLPTLSIPEGNIKTNTDLGFVHLYRGDKASAEQAFIAARNELEALRASNADNADFYRNESLILAGLGQHAQAVDVARKATTLSNEDDYLISLARIYAHFGDADLAFETIQKLIDMPTGCGCVSAATLRRDPIWDPIRQDPRFEKATASLGAKEVK